jgi:hypothetical protein
VMIIYSHQKDINRFVLLKCELAAGRHCQEFNKNASRRILGKISVSISPLY